MKKKFHPQSRSRASISLLSKLERILHPSEYRRPAKRSEGGTISPLTRNTDSSMREVSTVSSTQFRVLGFVLTYSDSPRAGRFGDCRQRHSWHGLHQLPSALGRVLTLEQIFIGWNGIDKIRSFLAVFPRQFHRTPCFLAVFSRQFHRTPCQLIATHAAGPKHHTVSLYFACAFGVPFLRHFTAAFKADHKHSSLSTALVFPYFGAAEPSSWCRYRALHSLGTPGQRLN